jgi:pimeloyl-ACP methyl ester carboxylesterase
LASPNDASHAVEVRADMTRSPIETPAVFVLFLLTFVAAATATAQDPGELLLEPTTFVAFDGTRLDAESGTFYVLENRTTAESAVIPLALVRLPSTSAEPGPPIIFLAGGPGGSGIESVRGFAFPLARELLEFGDVIALDQRGTGASRPSLSCPSRDSFSIPSDQPFDPAAVLAELQTSSERCASTRRSRGIDLNGYNTEQSADDLDELRQALGAEQVILWGESYGTHLAMAAMRRHGPRVAKAILHGAEGPNHTLKLPRNADKTLKALAREIRADGVVGPALPDPVGTLKQLIVELDAEPQTVDGVTFGGQDLALIFAAEIGDEDFFELVPRLLATAERGDYTLLAQIAGALRQPVSLQAMTFAMDCASGASAKRLRKVNRQARKAILGALTNYPFPEVCDAWGVTDLGDEFRSTLRSDVRTLFVSGTLDGRTPVSNANELRRGLSDSEHLILEGISHDRLMVADPRVVAALEDFLSDRPLSVSRISFLPLSFEPVD